ncbi:MAG: CHASE2 domain-containing protein [Candidatus Omnitrophota bacterium]|nr:CHASE2 domain-containing protein [Candidatus Omnitrophota bacterium]
MKTAFLKKYTALSLFACLAAFFLAASYFRFFESYELGSLDARFLLRAPPIPVSDKIAMIEIGEDTIKKLGRFPFDRSYYAIAIKALSEFGAKAVIFDLLLSEPHKDDRDMIAAMKESGNVYLSYAFDLSKAARGKAVTADGYLANVTEDLARYAKAAGQINIVPDIDGKFRRVPLFIKYENALYPYVSMKAACDYLGISAKDIKMAPGQYIKLGGHVKVPLDDRSEMIINFSGRWGTSYRHYSFVDLLQAYAARASGEAGIIGPDSFKDKICIIGLTAAGTSDIHPNPFETLYPGMGIHAEVINSIFNKNFITRQSKETNLLILMILGLLVSVLTMRAKPVNGLLMLFAIIVIFIAAAVLLFDFRGIWVDMVAPILAMGFIYLSCTLYKYISEWKKRLILENELGIAKTIQESFLPKSLPATPGLDISAKMLTARQVGGDLYDFIEFSGTRLGVMIGDVSGKGVPASLFMAMVTGAFKFFAATDTNPDDTLNSLNEKLVKESSSGLFVTVFYAILDLQTGTMLYGNGGHLPALFLREKEEPKFLDTTEGAPLGLMEGNYSSGSIDIRKGDTIIFYTDGVTEAMNSKREMYGTGRLSTVVRKNRHLSSQDILAAVEKDVRSFEPKSEQHDDITAIVVKIV